MKLFVYKCLVAVSLIFVLYHLTIGYHIRNIKVELSTLLDKEKVSFVKDKIREEMKNSLKRDRILDQKDSKLLKAFIEKISNEINE